MKLTLFGAQRYDRTFFDRVNQENFEQCGYDIQYQESLLTEATVSLAQGSDAVCIFVNDQVNASVLEKLHDMGIRIVLLRCAGYNQIDIVAAQKLGITVARVPAYSPEAVAEHTIAMILTLNRRTHRAFNRVREGNFSLDGLIGWNLHGKTVGLIGTGKIGVAAARIFDGFGCRVLGNDPITAPEFLAYGEYVDLGTLLAQSDIVSLHCPLLPSTHHLINAEQLALMKDNAMLVNTSRGALVDTPALIEALKMRKLAALAIDVYEQEGPLFFQDRSFEIIDDEVFQRLIHFPNVLVTGHQGFFTEEAVTEIAQVTLGNLQQWQQTGSCSNHVPID